MEESEPGLTPGDVRLVFKELGLIGQLKKKRGSHLISRHTIGNLATQKQKDQEALVEQISALFFTDRIEKIDFTYLQDFLIILMSTQVPRNDKISVLQKIIQECITKANAGKDQPTVKLAS